MGAVSALTASAQARLVLIPSAQRHETALPHQPARTSAVAPDQRSSGGWDPCQMEIGSRCACCCARWPWHDMGAAASTLFARSLGTFPRPAASEARRVVFSGLEARITRLLRSGLCTDSTRTSRNRPRQSKMRGGFEEQTRASLSQAGGLPWLWVCQPANRCPSPPPPTHIGNTQT